jgi:hypothetical protein
MRCFGGRHSIACCATTRLESTWLAIAYRQRRGTVEGAYVRDRT